MFVLRDIQDFPKKNLAIAGLVLVALGYSVLGLNSRLLNIGFEPLTQVYVRIMVGFLLSVGLFHKKLRWKKLLTIPARDWFWLLVMSVVGYALGVWMITIANINAKLVNSAVIYATIPFVVYVYSYFLLTEKVKTKLLLFLFVALYGIAVIASKSFVPALSGFGEGEMFAFLAVLASGWWSIGIKKLSNHLSHQEVTTLTMLIAAITAMIIALGKGETISWQVFTLPPVIVGIVIGAILNVGLTFFENYSFRQVEVVFGNQLLMTSTLFSLLLGFVFYRETISFPEIAGGFLIVFSVWQANKLLAD